MCGITGFWLFRPSAEHELKIVASQMNQMMFTRGPDGEGVWTAAETGLALAQRRLSIIDLSETGRQPMASPHGRYIISYNGEMYNYRELRLEAEGAGIVFRGSSDTEVFLALCELYGPEQALKKANGMFAIILWDKQEHKLILARDRAGIKPLYFGFSKGTLFFGSQTKTFTPHPDWQPTLNLQAVADFLRFSYIPTTSSIYEGFAQVAAGEMITISSDRTIRRHFFWCPEDVYQRMSANPFEDEIEAQAAFDGLLNDAVSRQMIADVPLGGLLSGGIDSSTVVAFMQKNSTRPIKTFTIGFDDAAYDEAASARAIAQHLKTDHTELYIRPQEIWSLIEQLGVIYDEPFADSSQLPTLLLSQLARSQVTVALSGDGGDELFCGYNRYLAADKIRKVFELMPFSLRKVFALLLKSIPLSAWDSFMPLLLGAKTPRLMADKVSKIVSVLQEKEFSSVYKRIVTGPQLQENLVVGSVEYSPVEKITSVGDMQFQDFKTYLPDDVLTKVDRASMHFSLEVRVPLLDHRLVEAAWRLPMNMKVRGGKSKWMLRQLLHQHLPEKFFLRPKMGFGVPIDSWLRGPLKEWAADLLSPASLKGAGFLNAPFIEKKWHEHVAGTHNWHTPLWSVLMFQQWKNHWMGK